MASRENKLSRKHKLFPLKHGEGEDSDYNGVDTCESISQEFDRRSENEIPKNNSWVNYEDGHDFEGISIDSARFCVDFEGFKSNEVANVKKYKDKFHNMLQNVDEEEILELKNADDSDIDLDLDFDLDFSGFKSNEGVNLKEYKDKFINMVQNYEKEEENPDLNIEDYVDNFSDSISKPSEDLEVKKAVEEEGHQVEDKDGNVEENEEMCNSWGHTYKKKAEEEEGHQVEDKDGNVEENEEMCNNWGHTYSYWRKTGNLKHFRCIKPDCPSFIIVYEDPDEENENKYLFSVKECQYHQ